MMTNPNVPAPLSTAAFIESLTPADVVSVYSGVAGACCCGCKGNHRYNPEYVELAGERRGYAVSTDEISARSVAIVLGKLRKHKNDAERFPGHGRPFVSVEIGSRVHVAYLR